SYANCALILQLDPRLEGLRMSRLGGQICLDGQELGEAQLRTWASIWLSQNYNVSVAPHLVQAAVEAVAQQRLYSPVQEYLDALRWDGRDRYELLCQEVLGLPCTELAMSYLRNFLVSAVARALRPGCKVDTALVLIGPQGARKSSFFRTLFGEYFGDSPIPIGSKDAAIQLQRCWGYEAAEMESLSKGTAEAVKQFLSTAQDLYRPPYMKAAVLVPRHSVMCGTTNRGSFLVDETGSRRFWPLEVQGPIDTHLLARHRDQLWAQAVSDYQDDPTWWLTRGQEEARVEQAADFVDVDVWDHAVESWMRANAITSSSRLVLSSVLSEAIKMPLAQQDRRAQLRLAALLTRMGWVAKTVREGGATRRCWVREAPK
ncbi:MAG: hypothetical protein EBR33_12110, partial [Synechococcaceae bacterium WB4_1_0192]|nr:hypothetical protein [Synechococcaceae bacterium WB4_1_0192]